MHEDGEAAMKCHEKEKPGAIRRDERVHAAGKFNKEPATSDLPLAGDGLLLNSNAERPCADYSEEAIPERDPAYRLQDGTLKETHTVEYLPAAERIALARQLEQLGMSAARAAVVANL
jgi:hypothetical protein